MSIIRRKKERQIPELNTSSLPDLIFTVLFFFMIVTHMRSVPVKVAYQAPQGTELAKLAKKSTTIYIFVGRPLSANPSQKGADTLMIQVNDRFMSIPQLTDYLIAERERMSPDELEQMTVSLKADKEVPMGMINDVKQALRKANTLKVHYSAVSMPDADKTQKSAE